MNTVVKNPMLPITKETKIFIACEPVDFRRAINGLSELVKKNDGTHLYDGSVYVFFNKDMNKIKCLFWDGNGFVLYFKRFDLLKIKTGELVGSINQMTHEQLCLLISGHEPTKAAKLTGKQLFKAIASNKL